MVGEALFSVHMVQHEMLMLVAAPLLVLGHPLVPVLKALSMNWRKALGAAPADDSPGFWTIHFASLWA
jgi:putative membrane protein